MNILITGAAGLLGSRLSEYFCDKSMIDNEEIKIIGVDNLAGNPMVNVSHLARKPPHKFHEYDVTSYDNMSAAFAITHPDIVYHFAAYAAEGLSPFIRMYNYKQNHHWGILLIHKIDNLSFHFGLNSKHHQLHFILKIH